jgi:fatty-acyl-CoA synthase
MTTSFSERLTRDWTFLVGLVRTLLRVRTIAAHSTNLVTDDLERAVDAWRDRTALTLEGVSLTYGEMDALANRFAHWAETNGLRRGSVAALMAPNRLDYLPIWFGLSKIGVVTALINSQLAGDALVHCLEAAGATHCIVDDDTSAAVAAVNERLTHPIQIWTLGEAQADQHDLSLALKSCSRVRPNRSRRTGLRGADTALYIFTSGTTGQPKAARIAHMRAQLYMRGFAGATGARPFDRILDALPLYHATGGLCAPGAALLNGAALVIRRHFSASRFWSDLAAEACTMFVYIGELGAYLAAQPPTPDERVHKLRLAFGNGLRAEVWKDLVGRFGVPRVLEFYGSTEGNVSLFNFPGRPGALGREPRWLKPLFNVRLVNYDVEAGAPVRGADGRCVETAPDAIGECIGKIGHGAREAYSGYADRTASEKKILRDAFRSGDAWFQTGDLMRQDRDGYFYFVDRVGDTFRWKGENVSTTEVADLLLKATGVREATVYGVEVPGHEGRAGMAGLVVDSGFDIAALAKFLDAGLPPYAQPVFVRLLPAIAVTGTFKHRKTDLVAEGYDPEKAPEPIYARGPEGYAPLTQETLAGILSGSVRL